ncbi:alpha/beta fold hydrolase [Haloplanus sp. GCM10025708]|uniref:alpha/beta fold hydrolase n=1 Tax=Haloplanus sp. GCM10025708 TaxID=3252679 RepID=UPI003619A7AE
MDRFAEDFRVVTFDVRGHGRTGVTDRRRYSIDLFAADLRRLLAHLELDRPLLCGLSLGSMVVQSYLDRHPEDARGAILAGPVRSMPPVELPPRSRRSLRRCRPSPRRSRPSARRGRSGRSSGRFARRTGSVARRRRRRPSRGDGRRRRRPERGVPEDIPRALPVRPAGPLARLDARARRLRRPGVARAQAARGPPRVGDSERPSRVDSGRRPPRQSGRSRRVQRRRRRLPRRRRGRDERRYRGGRRPDVVPPVRSADSTRRRG